MRRYFSEPTPSKAVGKPCSPFSMPGQTIRHGTFRTISPAATAPPRPTTCWRVMAARGGYSTDAEDANGREAQDFVGAGGCGRNARHRRENPDQAGARRRDRAAGGGYPFRHNERPAAAWHGHAV